MLLNKFWYLPYAMEMNVLFHQANVLVNSAKWNILAIFVYKIIILEHLWSYTIMWPKRKTGGVTSGAGTSYCYGAPEFIPGFTLWSHNSITSEMFQNNNFVNKDGQNISYIYFPCIREIRRFDDPKKSHIFWRQHPREIWLFRGSTNFDIFPRSAGF
jgi:hypothetical protein